MKDWKYYVIAGSFLILTATGKTLDNIVKKKITGKLAIMSSLLYSIIGGTIAGFIASVYIDTIQIQWVLIAGGSWMGERVLDVVADAMEEKIDLIFKKKNDEN